MASFPFKPLLSRLMIVSALCAAALVSSAQVDLSISITARTAPPPLVVYTQPPCPVDGYIWNPGYWAYDPNEGYYWVSGVWVSPPQPDYLWTPPYWGFANGIYGWHSGYWGTQIGFYGGVNYGAGYYGSGYSGGMWQSGRFRYNTAVTNVNTTVVRNVYVNKTVINNTTIVNNHTSYNGGPGGLSARPSTQEQTAMRGPHVNATSMQQQHQQNMRTDRNQLASSNHGQPKTAAMNKVGGNRFNAAGKTSAPANRPAGNSNNAKPATANRSAPVNPSMHTQPANRTSATTTIARPAPAQHRSSTANRSTPANAATHNEPANRSNTNTPQNRQQAQPHPARQARPMQQARPAQQPRPQEHAAPEHNGKK